MVGQDTGKTYRLGEQIKICVDGVERLTRTIDFSIPMEDDDFLLDEDDWEE